MTMPNRHQPSIDGDTWDAIFQWSKYLADRLGRPVSMAATIKWLATGELRMRE